MVTAIQSLASGFLPAAGTGQKDVAEVAAQHGVKVGCETRRGHPAKTIVTMATEGGYDLIVVGHSDHSEMWGRLLGDTADRISGHAHCSVLIVKN